MPAVSRESVRLVTLIMMIIGLHALGCGARSTADASAAPRPVLISDMPLDEHGTTGAGRVIEAPANITSFAPVETVVAVDASTVNLRQVFEDLGPDATLWYQHVQALADPFFEGRAPGTRGADLAADYIEFYFRHYGLEPAFGAEGYRQPFTYSRRDRYPTVDVSVAELSVNGEALEEGLDFVALGNSGSAEITAPLSFVGYGIASGPDEYSSFDEETDLSGRVALLLRYAPLDESGEALWAQQQRRWQAAVSRKMRSVTKHGAAGILMVNPPGAKEGREDLEPIERSRRFGPGLEIPVLQITPEVADRLLRDADPAGRGLTAWRRLADRGEVGTVDLGDTIQITARTEVQRQRQRHEMSGQNLGAVLPGAGELSEEWVVIGAHHDHVGTGTYGGVMPSNRGKLHPGADDNASGTAGVLVLAKKLAEAYDQYPGSAHRRSILFLTFDGEEMGLKGSTYFADHPAVPPQRMSILLNMDMIGRLRAHTLSVLGTETGVGLPDILQPLFERSGLTVAVNGGGSGRSDDASFHSMGVPALHFFTGMHREYTSPADQAYTVNPAGAEQILELMEEIALVIAIRPQQLAYREPPSSPGQDRGYGPVRLGIRPGMGDEVEFGVVVDAVSEGTAADEGGMLPGDVIVAWDDSRIEGLAELFEQLQQHQPGDRVKITVLRDGGRVDLDVTMRASGG